MDRSSWAARRACALGLDLGCLNHSGNWLVAGATAVGLSACGILNPAPTADVSMDAPAAPIPERAASNAGGQRCETSDQVGDPDLRIARCEAIAQINSHLQGAADEANTNVDFNALSWPLGVAALYWKLRDPTKHSLLAPGLAAAGTYGFLNSRVPKQADLNLQAVQTMACAYAESTAYVYTSRDLYAPASTADSFDNSVPPGVLASMRELQTRLTNFRDAAVMLDLSPKGGSAAPKQDSLKSALSGPAAAKPGAKVADIKPLWTAITTWESDAADVLSAIAAMRRQTSSQSLVLRGQVSGAEVSFRRSIVGNAPPPRDPVDTFKDLLAELKAGQAALASASSAASTPSASAQGGVVDPTSASELASAIAALDPKSKTNWLNFVHDQYIPLSHAVADARHWTVDERTVQRQVADAQRTAFGCTSTTSPAPPPQTSGNTPTPTSTSGGTRPTSSVTPPPSGTPLPSATSAK